MIARTAAALAVAAGLAAAPAQAEELKELNFGIISTESSQNLKQQWLPFLADMEKALGMKVNAFFAPDYAGVIEGMRFNKVQIAWFGNKSAMEAVDRAGGEIFVQTSGKTKEGEIEFGYWSLLVTHKDSDKLNGLKDVLKCDQSLNFGNGDPNSTSGFLVPSYYVFAQNDVDPKKCYKTVRNANHETNLMAVANKQVDFATNNTESLGRFAMAHPEEFKNIKVIWKSPLIPKDPIVYRKDLPKDLKTDIKTFFLSYGRMGPNKDKELSVLQGIGADNWLYYDSSDAQLIPIRQLELFKAKTKLINDDKIAADEKKAKLAEIEKKLKDLDVLAAYAGS